jgi:hypothetical protein
MPLFDRLFDANLIALDAMCNSILIEFSELSFVIDPEVLPFLANEPLEFSGLPVKLSLSKVVSFGRSKTSQQQTRCVR